MYQSDESALAPESSHNNDEQSQLLEFRDREQQNDSPSRVQRIVDALRTHRGKTLAFVGCAALATMLLLNRSAIDRVTQEQQKDDDQHSSGQPSMQHESIRILNQSHSKHSHADAKEIASAAASPAAASSSNRSSSSSSESSALIQGSCEPPYPGYPFCEQKVAELSVTWNKDRDTMAYYVQQGVDGTKCSFLNYLNTHGFYCPEAVDYAKEKIRGVNIGGWLVLEPWITPSLFTQFDTKDQIQDQWSFCERLGAKEARRQLEKHWDTWLTEDDIQTLAQSGVNHIRIPVGYWMFGEIKSSEPWVNGDLPYLERALKWCAKYNVHAILDLHTGPGSQNGFDNSGRKGVIEFDKSVEAKNGKISYPNIERALRFIDTLTKHFVGKPYTGTVVAIEPINEAFISIPLPIVKDYYLQSYEIIKSYVTPQTGDIAVLIGDSFRFGASWDDFMLPPHYRHVWIDTHIYHVFDMNLLQMNWSQHIDKVCLQDKPSVAVAPLSTVVGEWSLATTDCAKWLNGYNTGARYEGQFKDSWRLGSCDGEQDPHTYTPQYRAFLREFAEKQMDAYESGSSEGWFFWAHKTETSPEWSYLMGLKEQWIPKQSERTQKCV